MKFYTNYNRREVKGSVNSGKKLVKTAGYIPFEEQLIRMQQAGDRLAAYREKQYMYKDDSLAERDTSMPLDIYQDKLDALQISKDFVDDIVSKASAANEQKRAKDEGGATSGATTEDAASEVGEAAAESQQKADVNAELNS